MENALLIGLSRQVALARELDVVANNVANINTTGFKADGVVFQEFVMPVARANQFAQADRRLSYVHDRATWNNFAQGATQSTGNPLDVAIDGQGFLVVQTPRGERYTRNGALQINATGQLVTSDGDQVLGESGPIVFQATDNGVSISADGTVSVREGASSKSEATRGKLRVVTFDQLANLQKDSSSTFAAVGGAQPVQVQNPRLVQGAIEKSNVQPVLEMSRLIELTRSYTQIATMLQSESDMRRGAIDKLADVAA